MAVHLISSSVQLPQGQEQVLNLQFQKKVEEELIGKHPVGKKKTHQAKEDAKLVRAMIAAEAIIGDSKIVSSIGSNGALSNDRMGDFLKNILNVICNVMQSRTCSSHSLLIPLRGAKAYATSSKEQMALLHMAASCEKHQSKLEKDLTG